MKKTNFKGDASIYVKFKELLKLLQDEAKKLIKERANAIKWCGTREEKDNVMEEFREKAPKKILKIYVNYSAENFMDLTASQLLDLLESLEQYLKQFGKVEYNKLILEAIEHEISGEIKRLHNTVDFSL